MNYTCPFCDNKETMVWEVLSPSAESLIVVLKNLILRMRQDILPELKIEYEQKIEQLRTQMVKVMHCPRCQVDVELTELDRQPKYIWTIRDKRNLRRRYREEKANHFRQRFCIRINYTDEETE
ncbi:MAG: hypothetical protein EU533_08360 [Promethearchaeota archaeon]|nr:MAG: hypothetical protein EU533_08360 [Candidatus Lokiarchaeota archaeon]